MSETTVYVAKKIITMNPMQPEATHVAVRFAAGEGVSEIQPDRSGGLEDSGDFGQDGDEGVDPLINGVLSSDLTVDAVVA